MVYRVKGCCQVKKSKQRNISIIQGEEKIIDDFQKCSFGTVYRSVGRLKAVVDIVGREVARELRKNQFFNYLGDKGKIGDRAIVLQFILVKRVFFFFFLRRGVTRAVLKT